MARFNRDDQDKMIPPPHPPTHPNAIRFFFIAKQRDYLFPTCCLLVYRAIEIQFEAIIENY